MCIEQNHTIFTKMVIVHDTEYEPLVMVISQTRSDSECKKEQIMLKLQQLTKLNGYEIVQKNGQREYAPSADLNLPIPSKGCEVFIGKLPTNLYEDELIPLFEQVGKLYKFRLMLTFSEKTRGFAFATYFTQEVANRAIAKLNGYEIRPKLKIGVYKSVDNCRLFIGNIPTDKKKSDVWELLHRYVNGIREVIMYQDCNNPQLNRGYVFVEFETHSLAAMARRQFTPENLIAWEGPLFVDWADPLPDVDIKVMAKVTILYLKHLPVNMSSTDLNNLICDKMGPDMVKKTHKVNNYAFIHFTNRKNAECAFKKLTGLLISGQEVEIEWARPRIYSKKNRLSHPPSNLCISVSPSMRKLVHQHLADMNVPRQKNLKSALTTGNSSSSNSLAGTTSSNETTSTDSQITSLYSYFDGIKIF